MNRPLSIFIVEDNEDTCSLFSLYLKSLGHEVDSAATLEGAVRKLSMITPDLVISDIGLPDGKGWDLPQRAALPGSVVTVVMSALGEKSDIEMSKAAGFAYHFVKPVDLDDFNRFLAEVMVQRADPASPSINP